MTQQDLRIRRVAIDTWRENVAYLHRDCPVVRASGFQALSKVMVQANGKAISAVLNVVDDERIVQACELGLSRRRLRADERGRGPGRQRDPGRAAGVDRRAAPQDHRRAAVARRPVRDRRRRGPGALFEDRTGRLRRGHQRRRPRPRRGGAPHRGHDRRRPPARLAAQGARRPGGRQALHRWHPRQPHLDAGGADRHRPRHALSQDVFACDHLARRHGRHDGGARRRGAALRAAAFRSFETPTAAWPGAAPPTCPRPTTS